MKVKWRKLFAKHILSRGEDYFYNKDVYQLRYNDEYCSAIVTGKRAYSVHIDFDGNKVRRMHCNCPYAQEGNRCKHMAAVLFEMEDRGLIWEKDLPKLVNLPLSNSVEYRYYDLEAVVEHFDFTEDHLENAELMIRDGSISIESVEEEFLYVRNRYQKTCKITCDVNDRYNRKSKVSLQLSKDELVLAHCSVTGCYLHYHYAYYGARMRQDGCEHIAAAFLLLDEYLQEHPLGDATDYTGQNVLDVFRQKRNGLQVKTESETNAAMPNLPVTLEPRLEIDDDNLMKLSFRIGDQKLYVVKKLAELVECVEEKKTMKLGKKAFINFASQSFDEISQQYYDLIRRESKMDSMREEFLSERTNIYYPRQEEIKSSIPLYGDRMDNFYDFAKGTTLPYVDKRSFEKKSGYVSFCEGSMDATLSVTKTIDAHGDFEGIHITGEIPHYVDGINYKYMFRDGILMRIDAENLDILEILRTASYSSEVDFTVGRNHLSEFFYRILPMLEEVAEVQVHNLEDLQQYLYPEGKFVFYLDAEDDNVTCLPKVFYGEDSFVISKDDTANPARDLYLEQEILKRIQNYFPYTNLEDGVLHCDADETLIFQVLRDGINALLALGEVQATDKFNRLTIRKKPQISVGVQLESDLLNLTVSTGDLTEEELVELLQSYRKKKTFHRLRNGDFVHIDDKNMEELSYMLEIMKIPLDDFVKGKMQIPAYRALYLDKLLEKNDTLYAKRDKNFKNLIKDFKTVSDSDYEVPESLQNIMRNYQDFGYKWLRTIENCKFGGILADDMGLGKTLQMIALLLSAKEEGRLQSALIVTPASLVYNWQAEFEKFAPSLKVQIITGTKRERESKLAAGSNADVFITSYDLLKRDIKSYADLHFTYQVIDEAQYIKTHTTAAAKSVKVIHSDVRFALTGTPIENRLSELWSIFDYLMPGFLYPYDRFRREFETPIVKNNDDSAMQRLKRMVEPFILRRLKGDVLFDLPEKIEEVHYVQFEMEQQKLYDGQAVYMKQMIEGQNDEAFQKGKMQILAELTKIRQICCDPGLCFENYKGESAKRAACMELIQSAIDGEHKVLLFSQFTSLLTMMETDLCAAGIDYYKITGETKKEERIKMVNQFNQDKTPVFLVSLKAGGTGLNLTGADVVIHYDPWWNLAAQNQATDRAHRIGQTRVVSVYKLIAKNSIEEKILSLQKQKGQLADEILAGKEGGLMTMSKDELLELL